MKNFPLVNEAYDEVFTWENKPVSLNPLNICTSPVTKFCRRDAALQFLNCHSGRMSRLNALRTWTRQATKENCKTGVSVLLSSRIIPFLSTFLQYPILLDSISADRQVTNFNTAHGSIDKPAKTGRAIPVLLASLDA